ncbi:methyl-accepting chemotaxis protein [Xanthomonas graminis]|uniref:Methyl-accepting chemotaxis sensory transducer n=1 Tax=Xanthomonas graminis pv. phlei TaxID=487906 RepID=A0A0K2ZVM1_9XANT|nr:cache domain-containing protein [Xanthomonas translucens]UKE64997.1 cache domain-containing protein [Xanthomonas translucens pv. phlei]CTP88214.1 methyl-accepting chemotaxis sensory transducer [Xanthomonas translucens pv. phlei]
MNLPATPTEAGIDDHIRSVVGLSDQLLGQLRQSLQRIDEINRTTDVISMNARIELARIGHAGRGFSVIAQEMDVLSRRVADAARPGRGDDALAYAARRMGQILESYTVYFDLVLAGTDGRILANGQPQQYASAGSDVSAQAWFEDAMRTRSGEQFGFQGVHASTLADGERVLVYACTVRDGGRVDGRVLGVLGIVFRWDALAQTVVQRTPLSEQEWGRSRVCIVDPHGQVLADSAGRMLQERIDFAGREALFKQPRGAVLSDLNGRPHCIAHAASPGYETYRTGWHSLILQAL